MSKKYLIKRIAWYLIIVFITITLNFVLPRLIPGDPLGRFLRELMRRGNMRKIEGYLIYIETFKARFGLDKDMFTQYVMYLENLLRGNLGLSLYRFPQSVQDLVSRALPWTIGLLSTATIISWTAGVLLGTLAAVRRESKVFNLITYTSLGLLQIPYYVGAIFLILLFAYIIPLFPSGGGYSMGFIPRLSLRFIGDVIYHSILPALSLIIISLGGWTIEMRGLVTSILGEDYILFAEAKGLKKNTILIKYAMRNALLPEVTGLAMALGSVVGGALLVEMIFSYPGVGMLYLSALMNLDYNLMQGIFLLVTVSTLTAVLLVDLLYPLIDPRVGVGYEK